MMQKRLMSKISALIAVTAIVGSSCFPTYAKLLSTDDKTMPNGSTVVGTYLLEGAAASMPNMFDAAKTVKGESTKILFKKTRFESGGFVSYWVDLLTDSNKEVSLPSEIAITYRKAIKDDKEIQEAQLSDFSELPAEGISIMLTQDILKQQADNTYLLELPGYIVKLTAEQYSNLKIGSPITVNQDGTITEITGGGSSEPDKPIEDKDTVDALKEVLGREVKNAEKILKDAQSNGSISTPEQKAAEAAYVDAIKDVAALAGVKTDVSTSSEKKSKIDDIQLPSEIKTYGDFAKAVTYLTKATKAFNEAINGTTPEGKVTITFSSSDETYGTVEAVYGSDNKSFVSGQSIPKGSTVTFTATVNNNNNGRFDGWTVDGADKGKETTLTLTNVTEATTVLGKFSDKGTTPPEDEKVTVTFSSNNKTYGTVEAVYGSDNESFESGQSIPKGSTVKFTATAINNGQFDGWTVNKENKGNTNPLTLTNVTETTTVVGNFSDKSTTPDVKGPSLTVTGAVYYDTSVTNAVYTGVATSVYGGTATATYASSSSPIATIDITGDYIQNFSLIGATVNTNNNSPFSENTEYNDISSLITVNENSNLGIVPAENKFDAEKVFASKRQLIVKYDVKDNPNKVVYLSIKVEEAKN